MKQINTNMTRHCVFGFLLALNSSHAFGEDIDACDSVDKCIKRIYEVAVPPESLYQDISQEERAVIDRILTFEATAVADLVDLLDDPNENVAQIGAAALRDVKQIDKKYLPQIIAGLDRKLAWLPPALGRIDSPDAAKEVVKRYLVSESAPHNQEVYAVELSGNRVVPFILEAASCKKRCGERDHYLLGYALGQMAEAERIEAAKGLIKIVYDADTTDVARNVILMIGQLGKPGLIVEADVLQLKEKRPDLKAFINQALVGMQSKHATRFFIDALNKEPSVYLLRDLGGIGVAGHDAGPIVENLLLHSDWDIRLAAVSTLGFIQYENSVPKLIALLNDPADVRLNGAAAKALGKIKAQSAKSALTVTAKNHWHPAVRKMASDVLVQLDSSPGRKDEKPAGNFAFHFFSYEDMQIEPCDAITLSDVKESSTEKLRYDTSKKKLESLSYKSEIIGYGVSDEEEKKQKQAGKDIIQVTPDNMVRHVESIDQVPGIALRAENGWLAGSNRGEWGGELVFIKDGGKAQKIHDENVENIYLLGDRYIAVVGLAHMSMNNGMLFELIPDKASQWSVRPWRSLPGAPGSSSLVETGELLINTLGGGSILVSKDGSMRMAPCVKKNKPDSK